LEANENDGHKNCITCKNWKAIVWNGKHLDSQQNFLHNHQFQRPEVSGVFWRMLNEMKDIRIT